MTEITALLCDYTFQVVALGSALLGIVSGVLGCFTVLRRQSLLGDGVSHSALPGVVAAFLLTGSKSTEALLIGALMTGLASAFLISGIIRFSRVKSDSALALVMSVFFGIGLVLLTYAQRLPDAIQAGLTRFIYGQASTLLSRDVAIIAVCGTVILGAVAVFRKELTIFAFDPEFARSIGYKTSRINLLLTLLTVLTIVLGLQTVGAVLMSAMLVSPAVAARQWTDRLSAMLVLAAVFGAVSGVLGALISTAASGIPTGPSIVVCINVIVLISLLSAPRRGIISRVLRRRILRKGRHSL